MSIVTIMGMLSAFIFLLPVVIILTCRLATNKSLIALLIYFFINSVYYLMEHKVLHVSGNVQEVSAIVINYLDVPLIFTAFLFFSTTPRKKNILQVSMYIFIAYEIFISLVYGFNAQTVIYIIGPGIALTLIYAALIFGQFVKLSIEKNKFLDKTLMIASILFAYGCNVMIYCFFYIQKTNAVSDVYLIYYIASIISSLVMSIGLYLMYKKFRQIKEVQITRKELAMFFKD